MVDTMRESEGGLRVVLFFLLVIAILAPFSFSYSQGPNNRNVSIDTQVNITGSAPTVMRVYPQQNVVLSAGGLAAVICNASIRDYNGYSDINNVHGAFFHISSSVGAVDENNTHYSNSSCDAISGEQSGQYANYSCSFFVNYYAINGTWNCSIFVNDTIDLRNNLTNSTTINPLYALNITTLLDFGNLSGGDYSANKTANVTNLGNLPINVSVYGYGRNVGDNLSFVCDQGNFSIALLRFSGNVSADYAQKQVLNSTAATAKYISGFTVNKTIDATYSLNETYWQFYADPAQPAFGQCNGTIVFRAEPA